MDFSKYGHKQAVNCETCEFYEYDDYTESYSCNMKLDEDEMVDFMMQGNKKCKYYRFYDEYKTVQKQN